MSKFLDEQGVQRLWDKTKNYVTNNKAAAEIIDITDSDIDFSILNFEQEDNNDVYSYRFEKNTLNYSDESWKLLDKIVECCKNHKHFIIETKNIDQFGKLKQFIPYEDWKYYTLEFNLNTHICYKLNSNNYEYDYDLDDFNNIRILSIWVTYENNLWLGEIYQFNISVKIPEPLSITSNDIDSICRLTDNWYKLGDDYIDKYNGTVILLPCDSENISDEEFNEFLDLMSKAYGETNDAQAHGFFINQDIREGMTKSIKVNPLGYLGGDLYQFEYSTNGEDVYRDGQFKLKEPLILIINWIV